MPVKEIKDKKAFEKEKKEQYGDLWKASTILARWKGERAKKLASHIWPSPASQHFFHIHPDEVSKIDVRANGEIRVNDEETVGFANTEDETWNAVLEWCKQMDSSAGKA